MPFDEAPQLSLCLLDVELRVVLDALRQPVVAPDRRVVLQHVENEALLDRLLHRVGVECAALDGAVGLPFGNAEELQRLAFRGGCEGEVAGVRQQLARLHQAVDLVLVRLLLAAGAGLGESARDRGARPAALAGVGLVNDDREPASALFVADGVQDVGELLDRRDDDLLAALEELAEVRRAVGVADGCRDLGVLLDGVLDLAVEDDAVRDDDNGVENRAAASPLQPDQPVGQPRDRVALAAAGRVLDQVAPAGAVLGRVGQEPADDVELVVARPDLGLLRPARLLVL